MEKDAQTTRRPNDMFVFVAICEGCDSHLTIEGGPLVGERRYPPLQFVAECPRCHCGNEVRFELIQDSDATRQI